MKKFVHIKNMIPISQIFADYGTDQFSIRFNDKGNVYVFVNRLDSLSFKFIATFQTKFEAPIITQQIPSSTKTLA